MVSAASFWRVWRTELPQGEGQHRALLTRAQTLVAFSGASVAHARHVVRLALQVHDGLQKAGVFGPDTPSARNALELAAMLQDVGRFRARRGHHKHSYRILGRMAAPLDWSGDNWEMVAGLARYHRGALPEPGHSEYGSVPVGQRKRFLRLAAVLRLANALDSGHGGTVRSIKVLRTPETIQLQATGFVDDPDAAPGIAIAKYLLETACGLPVVLQGVVAKSNLVEMPPSGRTPRPRRGAIGKARAALS
jgi:exopolyphosphatase/pppGpp-phosphohydrolase